MISDNLINPVGAMLDTGIQIALDHLAFSNVLSSYNIIIDIHDGFCYRPVSIQLAISILTNAAELNVVPIMIGPICTAIEHVALMLNNFNFLSVADLNTLIEPKENVIRMMALDKTGFRALPSFFKSQGWNRVFLLSETIYYWEQMENIIEDELYHNNITLAGISKVPMSVGLPSADMFDYAANDLAKKEHRVIIVLTQFVTFIACALYRAGLYGENFVYIWNGPMMFYPDNPLRPPTGCTNHMLAEILRSVILISQATPINVDPDHKDAIGMTGREYDKKIKAAMGGEKARVHRNWFNWRATFYSQTVGIALVLDKVERKLQSRNDSLSQWLTGGEKFKANGSYIRNMMRDEFKGFHYDGLNTYGNLEISAEIGYFGFFQMQQDNASSDESISFHTVPVSYYNGPTGEFGLMKPFKWRTHDGKTPKDSIQILKTNIPMFDLGSRIEFIVSAIILLFVLSICFIFLFRKKNKDTFATATNKLTLGIFIGNLIFSIAYLLLAIAVQFASIPNFLCTISSVLAIAGLWIFNCCLLAKLEISKYSFLPKPAPTSKSFSNKRCTSAQRDSRAITENKKIAIVEQITSAAPKWHKIVAIVVTIFITFAIIWFAIEPLKSQEVNIDRIQSLKDPDTFYEESAFTCAMNKGFAMTIAFVTPFGILLIRIIQCGFSTKGILKKNVQEIQLLRISAYGISTVLIFGIATISLLFTNNPISLFLSILIFAQVILFVNAIYQIAYIVL